MENNDKSCLLITVNFGDTLEEIATAYQTTIARIINLNPNLEPNNLIIGQTICVDKFPSEHVICPIGSIPYQVKAGDTISSIATQFYTTAETILSSNSDIDASNLKIGQIICITEQLPIVPTCPSMNIYVINVGDTPYSIANKFGISLEDLYNSNIGLDPYNLMVGRIICLPFTPTPYIIVINIVLKSLTMYYLGRFFKNYTVAVGKPTTPTPLGQFYIFNKQVNPGGPFGTRWLGLSLPSYGIHGTNRPESIGYAASNGCIRMHNTDVEDLFSRVSVQTPVIII